MSARKIAASVRTIAAPPATKKYNKKRSVAERYDTTPRNVDRMANDGRLPPPDLYMGKIPLWSDESLDASDAEAMKRGRMMTVGKVA